MRSRISAVVVAITVLVALIGAQSPRGNLSGTVTDTSGAPLPGVTITLSGMERRTAVTNARGQFTFINLLHGAYEILAELPGFSTVAVKATVTAEQTVRVSLRMSVGSLEETITVTGETPAADKQATSRAVGPARVGGATGGRVLAAPPGVGGGVYLPDRFSGPFHTEAYDHVDENGVRRVANANHRLLIFGNLRS